MLDTPALGPGVREATLTILAYLRSQRRDDELLIKCAEERGNGAVFKRLGFILESAAPGETELIRACLKRLTKGYAQLDPTVKGAGPMRSRWRVIQNVELPVQERSV
jgi:predicted transcriptional regulator of viral defense system